MTVIDEVQKDAEGFTLLELRTILGAFLFPDDDIYKSVNVLSGGEKTRLALIKVLLRPSNLLLLDEPTNHLDIDSREVLEDAIGDYQNTVIFAAHDRFMIDRLANKTIAVQGGHANVFPGNYTYATSERKRPTPVEDVRVEPAEPDAASHLPVPALSLSESTRKKTKRHVEKTSASVPDASAAIRTIIEAREARVRQLELLYEDAKRKLDFTRAREVWTERQMLVDEIIALRNQEQPTADGR